MSKMPEMYEPKDLPPEAFPEGEMLIPDCCVIVLEQMTHERNGAQYIDYVDASHLEDRYILFYIAGDDVEQNDLTYNYPCTVLVSKNRDSYRWFRQ